MKPRPVTIEILTALAAGDTYAYEVYHRILRDGGILVVPRDWTVYRELPRLVADGYIEVTGAKGKTQYHITLKGKQLLQSERARMQRLLQLLRGRI